MATKTLWAALQAQANAELRKIAPHEMAAMIEHLDQQEAKDAVDAAQGSVMRASLVSRARLYGSNGKGWGVDFFLDERKVPEGIGSAFGTPSSSPFRTKEEAIDAGIVIAMGSSWPTAGSPRRPTPRAATSLCPSASVVPQGVV